MKTIQGIFARYALLLFAAAAPVAFGSTPTPGQVKLLAQDGTADDKFGFAVSVHSGRALVGAYEDDDNGAYSGSAYIFDATTGVQQFKLMPLDGNYGLRFGRSVSLSSTLAVGGAHWAADNGAHSGAVYIFSASTGVKIRKLLPADGAAGDQFGNSVSISDDVVLVGANWDDDNGHQSGSAYLFGASTGLEHLKLLPLDGAIGDDFGCSVSISGDLALVGAYLDDDDGASSGSAYIFNAVTGQQLHKLTAPDGATGDHFGFAVSISGGLALVGSPQDDDGNGNAGSAYLFDAYTGQLLHKLVAADPSYMDFFGKAVSISGDRVLVGAYQDDDEGGNSGSAYVFDATTGQQLHKLTAQDGADYDNFGRSVSLSGDLALVGAYRDDDNGDDSGSAYVTDITDLPPGTAYCFGDPGIGTPCPCNNDNDGSVPGSGCDNGVFASGAQLTGSGVASVTADTLVLATTNLEPDNSGLYFQADNDLSPGVAWGAGLRCAGGVLKRLGVRTSNASGYSDTSGYAHTISYLAGNVTAGDTKYYQCWYRTILNPPCGPGVDEFNASNGYAVTWTP